MVPLTVGFLVAGPSSGILSDRYGARGFATGGMIGTALAFALLEVLPVNFSYIWFALVLLVMGVSMGMFSSPNRAAVMNALPADQRGAGAGMMTTFQNAASVLSIGVFFTVVTLGLAATLPTTLTSGLIAHGVPTTVAHKVGSELTNQRPIRLLSRFESHPDVGAGIGHRSPGLCPASTLTGAASSRPLSHARSAKASTSPSTSPLAAA